MIRRLVLVTLAVVAAAPLMADEGMWLYNALPLERLRAEYHFTPSPEWLDHLRLSSVRFPGGSGAFVSKLGLLLTNHHIARGCVSALSSPGRDYMNEGFVAATRADERPCPGLQVSELMAIERVTARVRGVERPGQSPAEAEAARRKEMAAIEKECVSKTGLRCDVVTLYSGREYDLYQAKRFTDVRLAFAPATQLAQFGGDTDNFEFPRWSADFALLRAYEDGKPATTEHFLAWSHSGVRAGDFVAVSGHPGSTGRRLTLAQREYLRDVRYPLSLLYLNAARDAMVRFGERGAEPKRIARDDLRSVENALKATGGYLSGLLDKTALDRSATDERNLRAAVAKDEALAARVGDPWSDIERALAVRRALYPRQAALAAVPAAGKLAGWARTLVRLAHERAKPSGERLREFRDTALPELLAELVATVPIYAEYEEATLAPALRLLRSELGPLHPVVRAAFGDRTPEQLAHEAVAGTALADAAERTRLSTADGAALDASTDPMIRLLGALEPLAMEVRKRTEDEADAVEDPASARVADAYFGVHGTSVYPDATGTLRLSYGKVAGLRDGEREIPFASRLGGYFERSTAHGNAPPFDLPPALAAARDRLSIDTPLDIATDHDIIGGNSGSPMVDRAGELVGVIFDGNLWGLPNRFAYDAERARAVAVDGRAILEVLRKVYPARHLADELTAATAK